jgi:hypothetical protein
MMLLMVAFSIFWKGRSVRIYAIYLVFGAVQRYLALSYGVSSAMSNLHELRDFAKDLGFAASLWLLSDEMQRARRQQDE